MKERSERLHEIIEKYAQLYPGMMAIIGHSQTTKALCNRQDRPGVEKGSTDAMLPNAKIFYYDIAQRDIRTLH